MSYLLPYKLDFDSVTATRVYCMYLQTEGVWHSIPGTRVTSRQTNRTSAIRGFQPAGTSASVEKRFQPAGTSTLVEKGFQLASMSTSVEKRFQPAGTSTSVEKGFQPAGTSTSVEKRFQPAGTSGPVEKGFQPAGTSGPVTSPPALPSSAPLPGFASFLRLCRPPSSLAMLLSSNTPSLSSVHTPFTPTSATTASKIGCRAYTSAIASYGAPSSVSASAQPPARIPTVASTSLPETTPYPAHAAAFSNGGMLFAASTSPQTSSFRPVGVVLRKNSSAASSSLLSVCGPVVCQPHCLARSTSLYRRDPAAALPQLPSAADCAGRSVSHVAPDSDVKPVSTTHHGQAEIMAPTPGHFPGQGEMGLCMGHPDLAPPPLYDARLGIKAGPFVHSAGECVSDNVSVVTLRAPDPALFMTNHEGTTSQTESEFSLQDVKMQLTVKTSVPDPVAPLPSFCTPATRPSHEEFLDGSHPGLDMLSDVSLLVESLKSNDSTSGGRNTGLASGTLLSRPSSCEPFSAIRDADTPLLSPPQATYMGTVLSGPVSADSRPMGGDLYSDGDAHYTEMNPPTMMQDTCDVHEYNGQNYSPPKPCPLNLPPKKSCKFARVPEPEPPSDLREVPHKPGLVLKISRNVLGSVQDVPARRGRPRKRADNQNASSLRARDDGTFQRKRLAKIKQDPEEKSAGKTIGVARTHSAKQKAKTRSKETVYLIIPSLQNGKCSSKTDGNSRQSPQNLPTTDSVTKDTGSSQDVYNSVPQQHEGDQLVFLAQNCQSTSTDEIQACRSCSLPLDDQPTGTIDVSLQPSEAVSVSIADKGDNMVRYPESGARVSDFEILGVADKSPDFDPLVIAEEEVSSTQTQDQIKRDEEGGQGAQMNEPKSRRRSHICVSCFAVPSSTDESTPPSPKSPPHCHSQQRTAKKASNSSVSSRQTASKDTRCGLPCEVCCRKYATSATLIRHKRLFHPSLFCDTDIVEIPLVTGVHHSLPLSPSSIPSAMSPDALVTPRRHTSVKPTTNSPKKDADQTGDKPKLQTAKSKRKTQDCDEDVWEPKAKRPKKRKRKKTAVSKRKAAREEDGVENEKGQRKTVRRKKEKVTSKRIQRPDSSQCSLTRPLNFRTKKRTRVNSTVLHAPSLSVCTVGLSVCVSLSMFKTVDLLSRFIVCLFFYLTKW